VKDANLCIQDTVAQQQTTGHTDNIDK